MAAEVITPVPAAYSGNMTSANHQYVRTIPADTEYLLGMIGWAGDRTIADFDVGGAAEDMASLVPLFSQGAISFHQVFEDKTPVTGSSKTADYDFSSSTGGNRNTLSALVPCKGLDPTTPVRGTNTAIGTGTAISGSITTVSGDLVVAFLHRERDDAITTDTVAATEHINAASAIGDASFEGRLVVASQIATGTTTTFDFTGSVDGRDWTLSLVALRPAGPTDRITPERIAVHDGEPQDLNETANTITVSRPPGIGTEQNEVVLVRLGSQQRLRHSMMTTIPAGFTKHVESGRPSPDAQDFPHELWYALLDPTVAQPEEWEFVTSETWEGGVDLVQPTVLRYRHVDRTDPFGGGTPTWANPTDTATTATAPAATASDLKSVRIVPASTRRIGDNWTFATELEPISPDEGVASHAGIGEEPVTALTEMGTRDLGHDNLGVPGGYRFVAGSIFLLGAADDGSPGAPDHTGTKPVSWESALLVAEPDENHPNATTGIEVYRHTVTMSGDPATNGTLLHTFGPGGGSVVHATGWLPEETYFIQLRAVNAEGSTLGPEFQITTWSQAAHVLTTAQTLVVPMPIVTGGVDIDKSEYHGSNLDDTSWAYTHPGGSLLVFVSARDPDNLATMDGVTWNAAAMTLVRADKSSPTGDGSVIFGGIFWMLDAPAGTFTLAASTTGGTPTQHRWHVYSLSGPDLAVRNSDAWNGADPFGSVQVNVPCEIGDLVFDYLAWTFSAVDVASIGEDQTQRLADDSPTRQNGTSALVTSGNRNPDGTLSMTHTADDPAPSNVAAYWGVSISSAGGAATMRSLRADVGLAALSDEDLWHGN